MKRTYILFAGLLFVFTAALFAQTNRTTIPASKAAVQAAQPQQTPQLTEVERLKLENLELKIRAVIEEAQRQIAPVMQPLQDERRQLIQQVLKEHPGYHWFEATVPGQTSGLVPDATPPAKPPKPATVTKK